MGFYPYELDKYYEGWQIIKKLTNHENLANIKDIDQTKMFNPLYLEAYNFLKTKYDEPFIYKVWDVKGPIIGVNKDNEVYYYKYSFKDGKLTVIDENNEYRKQLI